MFHRQLSASCGSCRIPPSPRLFSPRLIESRQSPMDVYVAGTELLGNLQFPQGLVFAAGVAIQDAQIKVREFNARVDPESLLKQRRRGLGMVNRMSCRPDKSGPGRDPGCWPVRPELLGRLLILHKTHNKYPNRSAHSFSGVGLDGGAKLLRRPLLSFISSMPHRQACPLGRLGVEVSISW